MSDHTATQDPQTLGEQYLAVINDRDVTPAEYAVRLKTAESAIIRACGSEAAGWRFIENLTADNDQANAIDAAREQLQKALTDTAKGIDGITASLTRLGEKELYDVEVADGDTDAMDAAVVALRINLAALRHLTRDAKPEPRP